MPTNQTWKKWISALATNGDPELRSPAAMERLMKVLAPNIVRVPPITGKYRVYNKVCPIAFPSLAAKQHAEGAFERYLEKKQNLNQHIPGEAFLRLVAINEYRRETEPLRAPILAARAHATVQKDKTALVCGCFKVTLLNTLKHLVRDYGYKREDISIIWGGDPAATAKPLTDDEIKATLKDFMAGKPVPNKILKQIERQAYPKTEFSDVFGDTDFGDLKLGVQDADARQIEIDRCQAGVTKICLYTYAAGGVGLSLHHTDEFYTITRRRNFVLDHTEGERNYWKSLKTGKIYYSRSRETTASPIFSAQDYIQGLGRGHRSIFSLSDTYQDILFFEGSIEVNVMNIVSSNLRCLSKAVQARESWADAIHRPKETSTSGSEGYVDADTSEFADDDDDED